MSSSDASHLIEILILIVALVTMIATIAIGVFAFRGWRETREMMSRIESGEQKISEIRQRLQTYSLVVDLVLEKTSLIRKTIASTRMQQYVLSLDPEIARDELSEEVNTRETFDNITQRLNEIEWLLAKNDHEHRLFSSDQIDVGLAIEALVQRYGDGATIEIFDRLARLPTDNQESYKRARSQLLERMTRVNGLRRVYPSSAWTGLLSPNSTP
ncbi:hypothetical protein QA649_17805 [Bradyrhizobium sp. CB1717]|uniref:hypothetical protein n=1 Tax=Bradyrhizobium sp. CB1717 TaxID=3039154 RepID=UPI0024B21142|nr:hypothetical protein [Bradyrhizobium sp. CB1717]WFU28003.1 hypothetical protein QA649_17805 [Bradyrhizobium sp. CB1717]